MAQFYLKADAKLFDSVAKEWAKEIYGYGRSPETNKNQIRNFYEKVLEIYEEVYISNKDFNLVLPKLKMLNSKVEYAKGRKHIKGAFVKFMQEGINKTNSKEELEVFKLLFEAVLGFFTGLDFDKEQEKKQQKDRK